MVNSPMIDHIVEIVQRIGSAKKVARLVGCNNEEDVCRWIDGSSVPSVKEAERLLFVSRKMNNIGNDVLLRLWLDGETVHSTKRPRGPISPIEGIRLGDFQAVEASACRLERTLVE
jgi:hypothetical protein